MSISDILNVATSGLQVAQTQVNTISDNITNVNTVGYQRKIVSQDATVVAGAGAGVHVDGISNATNTYLQKASLSANAQAGSASAISNFLDQTQQLFGDPSSSSNFFSGLDSVYSAFSTLAATPDSTINQSEAVTALNSFLSNASSVSSSLSSLRDEANQQASGDVSNINSLLGQISQLNNQITQQTLSGGDASGSQNQQNTLITQLSSLINVQQSSDGHGGVVLRSQDGTYLAGDQGAATLSYTTMGGGAMLTATSSSGVTSQITAGSGEVSGLMQLAGVDIPSQMSQLGEYVSQAVSKINAAYNNSTTVPPPNTLTGTQIGTDLPTAISNFSGDTTVAITNASGVMQQRVDIDFDAGTMAVTDGSGTTSTINFTSANFLAQLNTALGTNGSASFSNGALSISASSSSNGVAINDSATDPSSSAGQNFGQFFGLNNLIQTNTYANVNGTLSTGSNSPFNAGGELQLELTDSTGAAVRSVSVTVPSGSSTVGSLISSLNSSVGNYGAFVMDSQGHLSFTPSAGYTGTTASVVSDSTTNSNGGPNMSQMLGIGWNTQASRATSFSINPAIAANPGLLATSQLDLTQTVNSGPALAVGDGSGAQAIADSGASATTISAAGSSPQANTSVSNYGSTLAGLISAQSTNAGNASDAATALQTQATTQLSTADGVNLDTELVNLTTYQQSYNASARLIQAASDMYQTLMGMVQ